MKKKFMQLDVVHDKCCGIDVGSDFHQLAIGMEEKHLFKFGVYTKDIKKIIACLRAHGIKYVAMESTGNYWQPLFNALQKAGFEVLLADGKQTKMLKDKTDVKDARSIYQLHRLGLLNCCFLPDHLTLQIRSFNRHRSKLIQDASKLSCRMQDCLRLMNLRLDNVLNDVTGRSGQKIIKAILQGERNPEKLAGLTHRNVKKSRQEIADSLEGNWDETQMYLLEDNYLAYLHIQNRINKLDEQIKQVLAQQVSFELPKDTVLKKKQRSKNQINIGLPTLAYQFYGVDLFAIESLSYNAIMGIISEIGHGFSKFKTGHRFVSYLRLAPNNRISGGKKLSSRVPKGSLPLKQMLRSAAATIGQNKKDSALKDLYNRVLYRKGRQAAITAVARKLALIIWNMITYKQPYQPIVYQQYTEQVKRKVIKSMLKKAKRMGISLEELQYHKYLKANAL